MKKCCMCPEDGTHHVYAEVEAPLTQRFSRIADLVACAQHADAIARRLKTELSAAHVRIFVGRLDGDDPGPLSSL